MVAVSEIRHPSPHVMEGQQITTPQKPSGWFLKLRAATSPRHGSKLMVRPDRPQKSQSNPASTPHHEGKASLGFHEPRGCGGVRIREDFTGADSVNQHFADTQTHIARFASTLCHGSDLSQGAGTPSNNVAPLITMTALRWAQATASLPPPGSILPPPHVTGETAARGPSNSGAWRVAGMSLQ